jgi:hypothetical protein
MKKINLPLLLSLFVFIQSCHHGPTYANTQIQFAENPGFRIGKWYSVTDSGTTSQSRNTNLDTIWFISDTLAGWTGFGGNPYSFFKTYVSMQNIYNIVYIAPNPSILGKMDTDIHRFAFTPTRDTLAIWWDDFTDPPQVERYVKMK